MRFKKGDLVLILENATGMGIVGLKWPLKGYIYGPVPQNQVPQVPHLPHHGEPVAPVSVNICRQNYFVVFDNRNDPSIVRELDRQGYLGNRWTYPDRLLKKDSICSVCQQPVTLLSGDLLVAEHFVGKDKCYGSYTPLELS